MTYRIGRADHAWYIVGSNGWLKGPFPTKRAARYALAEIEAGEDAPPEKPPDLQLERPRPGL